MSNDFHSPLARELEQFVAHMRVLGYSYRRATVTLKSFDQYVLAHAATNAPCPWPTCSGDGCPGVAVERPSRSPWIWAP